MREPGTELIHLEESVATWVELWLRRCQINEGPNCNNNNHSEPPPVHKDENIIKGETLAMHLDRISYEKNYINCENNEQKYKWTRCRVLAYSMWHWKWHKVKVNFTIISCCELQAMSLTFLYTIHMSLIFLFITISLAKGQILPKSSLNYT